MVRGVIAEMAVALSYGLRMLGPSLASCHRRCRYVLKRGGHGGG